MNASGITISGLTKQFGTITAVDDISFNVRSGVVTGFLGPNGAGKTTTLRMLLGLVRPTKGEALINGEHYGDIAQPGRVVGAALEASNFHPGRSGIDHLRVIAPHVGVKDQRCREVLDLVGLGPYAKRRAGGYSMGMRQRLGLATALLGDPQVLILDEPANGLDPEGIVWLRELLRHFAAEGRTVLVSSHVLAEVQHSVDDVVIIAGGQLVHASSLQDLTKLTQHRVLLRTPNTASAERMCQDRKWHLVPENDAAVIYDVTAAEVGAAAFAYGIEIHELRNVGESLEELFLKLTTSRNLTASGAAA